MKRCATRIWAGIEAVVAMKTNRRVIAGFFISPKHRRSHRGFVCFSQLWTTILSPCETAT